MTMKARIINLGNRTGDVLEVHARGMGGNGHVDRLKRGDYVDLDIEHDPSKKAHFEIKVPMNNTEDKFAGEPQVLIADRPAGSNADLP